MRIPIRHHIRIPAVALALAPVLALVAATLAAPPPRVASPHGKFRGECGDCHGANAWKPARIGPKFDHAKFGFPLEGAHAAAGCTSCHASLDFTQERQLCASCHADVHHGEFGTECARCHSARSFIDRATMTHAHQTSRFPLEGAHVALECEDCHRPVGGGQARFVGQPAECIGCHQDQFRAASSPDHVAGNFPQDCMICHTSLAWRPARFDHARTGFTLTGAHRTLDCSRCHTDGTYQGLSSACASCHQGDYDGTTSPSHASLGYSTECQTCHSTTSWAGATFDHSTTGFALTGAHGALDCTRCHTGSTYQGLSPACASCHQTDYDGTTNPSHSSLGFSTECQLCHNTTTWVGATFDHDSQFFPIYSGVHANRWTDCATCHTSPSNYTQFTCFNCHPHDNQTETDNHHSSVSGYSYDSQACYRCHPRGRK